MNDTPPEHQSQADQERLQKKQRQLQRLSHILDDAFTIPVLNIKVGWDAIIGLVPVIGDIIGAVLSLYLVLQAVQLKVGPFAVLRMLINIGIELLLGLVPVLGDFFDVTWRANRKNYELVEQHLAKQLQPDKRNRGTAKFQKNASANERSGLQIFFQLLLALLCAGALYYIFLQWQAGHIVIPDDFHPFLLFQRL